MSLILVWILNFSKKIFSILMLCLSVIIIFFFKKLFLSSVELFMEYKFNFSFFYILQDFVFIQYFYEILSYYCLELFILINIFVILTTKIKTFFRADFWTLKSSQKNEILFFKNNIIILVFILLINTISIKYNLILNDLKIENNCFFIEFQNSIINFAPKETLINNFSTFFYKNILIIFFIFILYFYKIEILNLNQKTYSNIFIYFILLNFIMFFSSYFILCYDFFLLLILLIGLNINIYSLLVFDENNKNIREATIKYFLASTIGTLFILGGISLIFLFYKTTNFFLLHNIISYNKELHIYEKITEINNNLFFISKIIENTKSLSGLYVNDIINLNNFFLNYNNFIIIFFLLIGLVFKLAVFPLHSWAVEIYSCIKLRLIAIFILILKFIFFIKTIQIFFFVFQFQNQAISFLKDIIVFIGISSIVFGSIAALFEDKIKKIIAYSSTNQLGFIFLGISILINEKENAFFWNSVEALQNTIFFLIIYLFSNLALIWLLFHNTGKKEIIYLKDLTAIPLLKQIQIFIILLSFSGLPPLAGFFSKFFILYICWKKNFYFISILAIISSIFSSYYYLKIIKISLFDNVNIIQKKNYKYFINNDKIEKNIILQNFIYIILFFLISFSFNFEIILKNALQLALHTVYFL